MTQNDHVASCFVTFNVYVKTLSWHSLTICLVCKQKKSLEIERLSHHFANLFFYIQLYHSHVQRPPNILPGVREKLNFLQVRELSGNLKKCQGIWTFDHCQGNVREFCHDNFFLQMISFLLLAYLFKL